MIYESITTSFNPGELDFTANSAVLEVAVNGVTNPGVFANSLGNTWLEPGDNLLIQGIDYLVPYGFGHGSGVARGRIRFRDALGNAVYPGELEGGGYFTLLDMCGGLRFPGSGLFVAVPQNAGRLQIQLSDWACNVSMVNLPTILNGEVIQTDMGIVLTHTLDLQAAP